MSAGTIARRHILIKDAEKPGHDGVTPEGDQQAPIDVYRSFGLLEGAGQRNSYVGVLGFTGAVHHTSHHRHFHLFHPGMLDPPDRHLVAEVILNLLRHLLKERAGGAPATGTAGDLGSEAAKTKRLENLLRDPDLLAAIAARLRREGDPDGVADSLLKQDAEPCGPG